LKRGIKVVLQEFGLKNKRTPEQ